MNNEHLKCGLRPPAQAPPHRGFCPGGRARWLGEIAECGMKTPNFKGMTLIEVIVVMIIIGIVAVIVLPKIDFGGTSSIASVDGAANMIASDIRYAQEFAMATRTSKTITFSAGGNSYSFNPTNNLDPTGQLPYGVTTTALTLTFNSLGEPTVGGGSSVTVSGGGQTRTISVVNYTGKVNIS
jgi:prepilin-type N-terminal cleavage/methylation domain-containing protein